MKQVLHRAPWLATGSYAPDLPALISNGAVLMANGIIQAVGPWPSLREKTAQVVEHEGCVLTPGLVNCHTHLELAWLASEAANHPMPPDQGSMTAWIRELLEKRGINPPLAVIMAAGRSTLDRMRDSGTILVADIGNAPASAAIGADHSTRVLFLHEMLGRDNPGLVPAGLACTPHAPYSTDPELIRTLKERARSAGQLFSIHVAESADEVQFLKAGTGPMRAFLMERGAWTPSNPVPGKGAISYLDQLQVLDDHTLCVHCVHLDKAELDLLARRQAKVCLCPGSNRYLGVGRAPVMEFLKRGLLPGLGTDSLASNVSLSLWDEMRTLRADWPELDPAVVFAMATSGGSQALGQADVYGLLAPGRTARFLAVPLPEMLVDGEILSYLTTAGANLRPQWVEG